MVAEAVAKPLVGSAKPRIAPPAPARSDVPAFRATAEGMGITLMPWQETAARYLTATDPEGRHLYREVAILVARQNGKTALMKPYIIAALKAGKRIMHIAQTRELPREMFGVVAEALSDSPALFPQRRGRTIWPRYGAGQEEIKLVTGGTYRIAAANRGGARGFTNDVLVIDELREMVDDDVLNAAMPTLTASPDPHIIYLSNAGTEQSVVLNDLRKRVGEDPALAWLEWSASPERPPDDPVGWTQANPSLGHFPGMQRELEAAYRARLLDGKMAQFETEHLCRWVVSMREPLVDMQAWEGCRAETLDTPKRPYMAVSLDPAGKRASVALAWRQEDGSVALRMLLEATGNPIDTDKLGPDIKAMAREHGVLTSGFDPMTDAAFMRYLTRSKPIAGQQFANATARFVAAVEGGTVRWQDCATVTDDLTWTSRKEHDDKGAFEAVRGNETRPITASLAAIRAVWLASQPKAVAARTRGPVGF
jgi:hypothetical protein